MLEIELPDEEATRRFGERLAAWLRDGDVLGLAGDLGAGKTTLSRSIARGLGIAEPITSPTFTLENRFPLPAGGELRHWDFYRLDENSNLEELGFYDRRVGDIFLVEWVDRLGEVADDPEVVRLQLLVPDPAQAPQRRVARLVAAPPGRDLGDLAG